MIGAVLLTGAAHGQELIRARIGRLAFPALVTMMVDVVKDRGFDRKNGIDLQLASYSGTGPYYAALATGEVDLLTGGTHVLQKMRNEGVPIQAALTYARLSALMVIARDPAIRTISDLKGKSIAANIGSAEYQILSIYGRSQGVVLGKDITVVQATPPLARTQLAARRVDAAMTWEPTATLTLRDNPRYRVILSGHVAWRAVAKADGWQLVVIVREDFLRQQPQAVPRLLKMFQEGQRFIQIHTDEADRIVQRSMKLPEGIFKEAVGARRLVYEVLPAWEGERKVIWDMFRAAVAQGYIERLPDEGVIYSP